MYRRLPADTAAALHPRVLTPTLQIILPHVQEFNSALHL